MTIKEKRLKIVEHCESKRNCDDCVLYNVELNCGGVVSCGFSSDEDVEKVYNFLTYGAVDVTRNIAEISDAFICGKCGICLEDCVSVEYDEDTEDTTYHVYEFKFCPECGRRVMEE